MSSSYPRTRAPRQLVWVALIVAAGVTGCVKGDITGPGRGADIR
jgi:hypothetical protein